MSDKSYSFAYDAVIFIESIYEVCVNEFKRLKLETDTWIVMKNLSSNDVFLLWVHNMQALIKLLKTIYYGDMIDNFFEKEHIVERNSMSGKGEITIRIKERAKYKYFAKLSCYQMQLWDKQCCSGKKTNKKHSALSLKISDVNNNVDDLLKEVCTFLMDFECRNTYGLFRLKSGPINKGGFHAAEYEFYLVLSKTGSKPSNLKATSSTKGSQIIALAKPYYDFQILQKGSDPNAKRNKTVGVTNTKVSTLSEEDKENRPNNAEARENNIVSPVNKHDGLVFQNKKSIGVGKLDESINLTLIHSNTNPKRILPERDISEKDYLEVVKDLQIVGEVSEDAEDMDQTRSSNSEHAQHEKTDENSFVPEVVVPTEGKEEGSEDNSPAIEAAATIISAAGILSNVRGDLSFDELPLSSPNSFDDNIFESNLDETAVRFEESKRSSSDNNMTHLRSNKNRHVRFDRFDLVDYDLDSDDYLDETINRSSSSAQDAVAARLSYQPLELTYQIHDENGIPTKVEEYTEAQYFDLVHEYTAMIRQLDLSTKSSLFIKNSTKRLVQVGARVQALSTLFEKNVDKNVETAFMWYIYSSLCLEIANKKRIPYLDFVSMMSKIGKYIYIYKLYILHNIFFRSGDTCFSQCHTIPGL